MAIIGNIPYFQTNPKDNHGVGSRPGASSAMSPPLPLWTCRRVPSKLKGTPAFPQATKKLPIWSYIPWYPVRWCQSHKKHKSPHKLLASYPYIPSHTRITPCFSSCRPGQPNTRPGQPCPARTTPPHAACRIKVGPSSQVIPSGERLHSNGKSPNF